MKKFTLSLLAITMSLGFTSCMTEDGIEIQETTSLLKSYSVKKDQSGSYFLNYNLNTGAKAESSKNLETNTSDIYLYSSDYKSKTNLSESLTIENDQFTVGFTNMSSGKKSTITVIDDNIVFAKDNEGSRFLKDHSITNNQDGTYQLDFTVKNNVSVGFIYNEEDTVYEIHLAEGKTSKADFSRTFTKNEGEDLKIDFVNHMGNSGAAKTTEEEIIRKPRMIIQEE